jgi:hypothetical protein
MPSFSEPLGEESVRQDSNPESFMAPCRPNRKNAADPEKRKGTSVTVADAH